MRGHGAPPVPAGPERPAGQPQPGRPEGTARLYGGSMELSELVAREAVRDLVARYAVAGDRGDILELAELFAVDGILDVGAHGGRWEGREEIVTQLLAVTERIAASGSAGPVRHHVSNLAIDACLPKEATAASYFLVLSGVGVDHWGRYRDRFAVGPDGVWRFVERVVRVDGHVEGSVVVRPAGAA